MGKLLDEFERVNIMKNDPQIPQKLALPKNYADSYYEAIGKPVEVKKPVQVQDIYATGKEAYDKAGGGWKGAGMALLTGLGKLGEFTGTETGAKLLAGASGDPYVGSAFLDQAGQARSTEQAQKAAAAQKEMELLKMRGEDVREAGKQASQEKISKENLLLQNLINNPFREANIKLAQEKESREATQSEQEQLARQAANMKLSPENTKIYLDSKGTANVSSGLFGTKVSYKSFDTEEQAIKAGLPKGAVVLIGGKRAVID